MVKSKSGNTINDRFIGAIQDRLAAGKRVRRTLPLRGRLHIDRQLPVLAVYRRPSPGNDAGMHRLITSEASYLLASATRQIQPSLKSLVKGIATTLSREFGAFLILEISASATAESGSTPEYIGRPHFMLTVSPAQELDTLVEAMAAALRGVKVRRRAAHVEIRRAERTGPKGPSRLMTGAEARALACTVVGLEVRPIHRDSRTGSVYPLVLRDLERAVGRALRQVFFEFARTRTTHRPQHFHGMGRRAMVKAVWDVDRRLAEVSDTFDFLLLVTPANALTAWRQFIRSGYSKPPVFRYRPVTLDPFLLKRRLHNTPIERLEDPAIRQLFREKQDELDRRLTMLLDINTPRFVHGSIQLYGEIDSDLVGLAKRILDELPSQARGESRGGTLAPAEFVKLAEAELAAYREQWPEMKSTVQLRNDTTGLMVSRGSLLVSGQTRIPRSRAEALLQHEIGTHVVTYYNGRAQPFRQLATGLAGYDALQEGLAVFSEYLVGGLTSPRVRLLAARVIAAHQLIAGASFIEVFEEMHQRHGFAPRIAFTLAMRVFRAGGLTKDAVYLKGLVELLAYLRRGGRIEPLLLGKMAAAHVPIIEELRWRQVLRPAPLRPRYLDAPGAAERLEAARTSLSVLDLVEERHR